MISSVVPGFGPVGPAKIKTPAMAQSCCSALGREPLHGVDDHVSVGAGVGDLDPAVLAGGELEGAHDMGRRVALRLVLLVHEDLGLAACVAQREAKPVKSTRRFKRCGGFCFSLKAN